MTSTNQRVTFNGPIYPTGIVLFAATLLILLGLVFQAAQLGWGRLWPDNFWLFSVIVPGLWNMLAVQWNAPAWQEVLKFWPLVLVATGMAMLLVQKPAFSQGRNRRAPNGASQYE